MAKRMSKDGEAAALPNLKPEIYLEHSARFDEARRALRLAQNAVQSVLKAAKADGVNIDVMRLLKRMRKLEAAEIIGTYKTLGAYSSYEGKPIILQTEFQFDKPSKAASEKFSAKQAEQDGYDMALGGHPMDNNPFKMGTEACVAWVRGHNAGCEFLAASGKLASTMRVPGRKRGKLRPDTPEEIKAAVAADDKPAKPAKAGKRAKAANGDKPARAPRKRAKKVDQPIADLPVAAGEELPADARIN